MSVRAYNITSLQFAPTETFNLWHDDEVMHLLSPYLPEGFDPMAGGYLEFALENLQEARAEARSQQAKEVLDQMIAEASPRGWARYWCF